MDTKHAESSDKFVEAVRVLTEKLDSLTKKIEKHEEIILSLVKAELNRQQSQLEENFFGKKKTARRRFSDD